MSLIYEQKYEYMPHHSYTHIFKNHSFISKHLNLTNTHLRGMQLGMSWTVTRPRPNANLVHRLGWIGLRLKIS